MKNENQTKGLAVRTFEQYSSISRIHIIPNLGRTKIKDLKKSQVDSWLRELEGSTYMRGKRTISYSANTLRLCRAVLGMALQWGISEGLISKNVARESKTPGGRGRPEKHSLSEDQSRRLIEGTRGEELGALWALMIKTGLRRGEALGLRWQDFDGESITVTSQFKFEGGQVVRGVLKTDKSKRRLKIPEFLPRDLETHRQAQLEAAAGGRRQPPELIFTNSTGTLIRPNNLQKRFILA